jgi:hypothetical protein
MIDLAFVDLRFLSSRKSARAEKCNPEITVVEFWGN